MLGEENNLCFVDEFRPLNVPEMRQLLMQRLARDRHRLRSPKTQLALAVLRRISATARVAASLLDVLIRRSLRSPVLLLGLASAILFEATPCVALSAPAVDDQAVQGSTERERFRAFLDELFAKELGGCSAKSKLDAPCALSCRALVELEQSSTKPNRFFASLRKHYGFFG
jgi:hypothetical protein